MKLLVLFSTASLLTLSTAFAGALLSDSFTDNDRTNQSLPGSAEWFVGGTGASASASGGKYTVESGVGSNLNFQTTTYFTNSGTVSLANIGDKLTLSFDVDFSLLGNDNSNNNGFRFGLYNSQGSRVSGDNTAVNGADAGFNDDLGYGLWVNVRESGNTELFERTGTSTTLVASGANTLRATGSDSTILDGTSTSATFSLERTAGGLLVSGEIAGGSVSFEDTSVSTFDYDMVHFFGGSSPFTALSATSGSFTLDNVEVAVSVIPEPSSLLLLLGAFGLFTLLRRRK